VRVCDCLPLRLMRRRLQTNTLAGICPSVFSIISLFGQTYSVEHSPLSNLARLIRVKLCYLNAILCVGQLYMSLFVRTIRPSRAQQNCISFVLKEYAGLV
jgi:hypothetical protein